MSKLIRKTPLERSEISLRAARRRRIGWRPWRCYPTSWSSRRKPCTATALATARSTRGGWVFPSGAHGTIRNVHLQRARGKCEKDAKREENANRDERMPRLEKGCRSPELGGRDIRIETTTQQRNKGVTWYIKGSLTVRRTTIVSITFICSV